MGGSDSIPPLCRYWLSILSILPEVRIFGMDFSMSIATALFLSIVRFSIEFVMVHFFGWPHNTFVTKNAASSVAAIVHSSQLVPALGACLLSAKAYNPSQKLNEEELWWQRTVSALLQFCTGYMLYDGLLNIVWMNLTVKGVVEGDEAKFLIHHVITILYMTSTRFLKAGHQSAMICMFYGELTNPFHNTYLVLETAQSLDCCNGPLSQASFRVATVLFAGIYFLIRGVVGTIAVTHMTWNLWTVGPSNIPWPVLAVWTLLIWAIMYGSIPFVQDCWDMLVKEFPALSAVGGFGSEL